MRRPYKPLFLHLLEKSHKSDKNTVSSKVGPPALLYDYNRPLTLIQISCKPAEEMRAKLTLGVRKC